ncbi:hypothetical protein E3Q23_01815 [Wallemia mellicola]|uniref:Uncharacterized protein n=1 Tax=Wallemia mellicola TaxID=1708541 RepID=A0A4T0TLV9_9BASI|nr:hypothetical protein E3Q23_01815 [Wallemia mellicola]TIC65947.1 hypothetical protein E3Q01_01876 [Wallemia mellicola]TIC71187.1 hypothetical protein E3Q03_00627 [Wallemia mellicola]
MRNPWLYQRRGSLPCHISHSRPQSETNSSCSHSSLRVLAHSKASVSANVARGDFTGISSFLHSQPTQKSSKCQIPNISDDIIEKLVLPIVLNDHIN